MAAVHPVLYTMIWIALTYAQRKKYIQHSSYNIYNIRSILELEQKLQQKVFEPLRKSVVSIKTQEANKYAVLTCYGQFQIK